MKRIVNALNKLNWGKRAYAVCLVSLTTAIVLPAQTLTTLYTFVNVSGTVFIPRGAWTQAVDGDFYGVTEMGGTNFVGTIFKITANGTLTTVYDFCSQNFPECTDGYYPDSGLLQATDGDLYGTVPDGGPNCAPYGPWGLYSKSPRAASQTTLYLFSSQSGDGTHPEAGLVQAGNGDFYGTTSSGGSNGAGTIFKITPSGTLTTLYSFCSQSGCTDGEGPLGAGPGQQRPILRHNPRRRSQLLLQRRLWDDLQDHPEWGIDDAVQLLLLQSVDTYGRRIP